MVDTGELENYLNAKSAKKGDQVDIISGGSIGEVPQQDGTKRRALNIPCKLNGNRDLIWTPGKMARDILSKATGSTNSDRWVGKYIVDIVKMTSFGQIKEVVILEPIPTQKVA